jgi:hypothetical protein
MTQQATSIVSEPMLYQEKSFIWQLWLAPTQLTPLKSCPNCLLTVEKRYDRLVHSCRKTVECPRHAAPLQQIGHHDNRTCGMALLFRIFQVILHYARLPSLWPSPPPSPTSRRFARWSFGFGLAFFKLPLPIRV